VYIRDRFRPTLLFLPYIFPKLKIPSIQSFGGETWRERDHLGDTGIDGRIVSRWIFRKWYVEAWTASLWLRIGTVGGHL
jgi:hypothetical protein